MGNHLDPCTIAFAGDIHLAEKFKELKEKFNLKTCIETGTYKGYTTLALCDIFEKVYTIEINKNFFHEAVGLVSKKKNVILNLGNSAVVLDRILGQVKEPLFIFLDAHWNAYNPLLDELKLIAKHGIKPVIAIHDFFNPEHLEFGFDSYAGQRYDFAWIRADIEKIYGKNYTVEYNQKATGAKRGVIFITP